MRLCHIDDVAEWRDLGRSVDYEVAFGFRPVEGEARELVQQLIEGARSAGATDEVVRMEYFSSAAERDRHFGFDPAVRGLHRYRATTHGRWSDDDAGSPARPDERHLGVFNVYVNVGKLKSMWVDASIALGVTLLTLGNPLPVVLTLVARAVVSLQVLDEDEAELVHVILRMSEGTAYERPLDEARVRGAYHEATVSIDDLIDRLIARGVVTRHPRGLQLVF